MGFNIMDLMNGATRAAVEGVDNYEAITLNLDVSKLRSTTVIAWTIWKNWQHQFLWTDCKSR